MAELHGALQRSQCLASALTNHLSRRLSRRMEVAAELTAAKEANAVLEAEVAWLKDETAGHLRALTAEKESVEAARSEWDRAEANLMEALGKVEELKDILDRRDRFFQQKGAEANSGLVKAM